LFTSIKEYAAVDLRIMRKNAAPKAFTFRFVMCETNETKLFKLCRLLKIVFDKVRSPPG